MIDIKSMFSFTNNVQTSGLESFIPFDRLLGTMLFYFLLGGYVYKHSSEIKTKIIPLILAFAFGVFLLYAEWHVMNKTFGSWDNIFKGYSTFATFMMSLSVFYAVLKIPNDSIKKLNIMKNFIATIGNNTLSIYYFHWIFGYTFFLPFCLGGSQRFFGLFANLIKTVSFTAIFGYLAQFLKKILIVNKIIY